jgi:hypothetical protein
VAWIGGLGKALQQVQLSALTQIRVPNKHEPKQLVVRLEQRSNTS